MAVEEGHVTKIDFPIEIAGRARIVRVERRPALGKCGGSSKEEHEAEDWTSQHSYGAKGGGQNGYEKQVDSELHSFRENAEEIDTTETLVRGFPPRVVGADSILVHPDSQCSASENQWQWQPTWLAWCQHTPLRGPQPRGNTTNRMSRNSSGSRRGRQQCRLRRPQCLVSSAAQLGAFKQSSSLRSRMSSGSGPQRRIAS